MRFERAEAYNAIDGDLHRELSAAFAEIGADSAVRAVVVTGAGKAFSSGGDLRWFQSMNSDDLEALFTEARKIVIDLLEVRQPIIAAVNGHAIGLGATLALLCDVVIASEEAKFGDPHVLAGVVAGDGGAVIWPWLIGMGRAKRYLLTGDTLTADEALQIGLVSEVVPAGEVLDAACALATRFACGATIAIEGTKASINKILRDSMNLVLDTSLALERRCFLTDDHAEAVNAFLDRRTPVFHGR